MPKNCRPPPPRPGPGGHGTRPPSHVLLGGAARGLYDATRGERRHFPRGPRTTLVIGVARGLCDDTPHPSPLDQDAGRKGGGGAGIASGRAGPETGTAGRGLRFGVNLEGILAFLFSNDEKLGGWGADAKLHFGEVTRRGWGVQEVRPPHTA